MQLYWSFHPQKVTGVKNENLNVLKIIQLFARLLFYIEASLFYSSGVFLLFGGVISLDSGMSHLEALFGMFLLPSITFGALYYVRNDFDLLTGKSPSGKFSKFVIDMLVIVLGYFLIPAYFDEILPYLFW
jgi:hypothetical protein